MSKALYRKYRSTSLDTVVGQNHVTEVLKLELEQDKVSHAYLFTGPRGVGKTSVARILAHAINKVAYDDTSIDLDIIEIDAASNNGVDDIRDLRDKVNIAPVSASKKVYIIDEVHMLSKQAFNALLKTLEEPPEHVVFILATTDIEKLPETIISRTQRFDFHLIKDEDLIKQLRYISDEENILIDDEALSIIAEFGRGSFRDSISMLDQVSSLSGENKSIGADEIQNLFGLATTKDIKAILDYHRNSQTLDVINLIDSLEEKGAEAKNIAYQLIRYIRQNITDYCDCLDLLEGLLDVPRSVDPSSKLIVTLALNELKPLKQKNVALKAAPSEADSLSIETKTIKKNAIVANDDSHDNQKLKNEPSSSTAESKETKTTKHPTEVKRTAQIVRQNSQDQDVDDDKLMKFEWEEFIEYYHEHHIALYSVLKRCQYSINKSELKIYAGNNFNKKKLDDVKYAPAIGAGLSQLGIGNIKVTTLPESKPPQDSKIAAIAAIMGGGEEVQL